MTVDTGARTNPKGKSYGIWIVGPNQGGTYVNRIPPRYTGSFAWAVDAARSAVLSGLLAPEDRAEVARINDGGATVIYAVKGNGSELFDSTNETSTLWESTLTGLEMTELQTATLVPGGTALVKRVAFGSRAAIGHHVSLAEVTRNGSETAGVVALG